MRQKIEAKGAEHTAFDRGRNFGSDLLGQCRLGGVVDLQVQGLRHVAVVHYSFAFLVLFFRLLGAFFLTQHNAICEGRSHD